MKSTDSIEPLDSDNPDAHIDETDDDLDRYARYEESMSPARAYRKPRKTAIPLPENPAIHAGDTSAGDGGLRMTYKPARHEATWLLSSLGTFFDQQLIADVQASVRGGKEANVYRCAAHPSTGLALIAAKVYRPQQFRNLRNDKMYREGRSILTADGRPIKAHEGRTLRAVGKKTDFGVQVAHTSWLMYEYVTLERLHAAGAAVPRPIAAGENAVLMEYIGDETAAAPALSQVALEADEAAALFRETLRNVELMLQHGLIHGDLSAYNILYWEGKITVIDFPQVTDCAANSRAELILERDVTRVCEYFAGQGVESDPEGITTRLWALYGRENESRMMEQAIDLQNQAWIESLEPVR